MRLAAAFSTTFFFATMSAAAPAARQAPNVGEATFFEPGLGSCGIQSSAAENVVAVSASLFDTFPGAGANPNLNPVCGRRIRASFEGKTVEATVVDRCPGCSMFSLDFSPAAFNVLAEPARGRLQGIEWTFI